MASPRCKPDRLHEDGPHPLGRGRSVWGAEAVPWKHEMASDRPESKASKDAAADLALPKEAGHKLGGARADFVASLGVMFAFYGLLVVGISLGRRHDLLAPTAPWLADILGLAMGAWLTRRAAAQ